MRLAETLLAGFDVVAANAASATPATNPTATRTASAATTRLAIGPPLREPQPLELEQPEQEGRHGDERQPAEPVADPCRHVPDLRHVERHAADRAVDGDRPALDPAVGVAPRDDEGALAVDAVAHDP